MKHLLRFKTFLILALLAMVGNSAWAQDESVTFSSQGYTNAQEISSYSGTNFSVTFAKGTNSNAPKYYNSGTAIRCYGGNTITVSSSTKTIASVQLSFGSSDGSNAITASVGNYSQGEWTGSANSVTFTIGGSSGNRRIAGISVTYEAGGTSISADNVDIEYNATAGEIIYSVNNPATGGFLSASTTASWLTVGTVGETVPFTCDANDGIERTATVTLTYTYGSESVSKNVLVTQAGNPNGPGTENNPYTVAQARAAIDAGSGTQGVYATGIVSEIITAYGYNNYSNITFNIVTQDGDSEFLQAFRCVSSTNADASTIAVGDIVVVSGNLTKYNTTYEFAQGCQVVSITHPAVSVEAPTFSPAAGTYADAQSVTISTATDGATVYYTTDGTEPTDASTPYTKEINISTTTTLKAIAYKGGESSTVATATYYICSAANPYTVTEALAFPEYPANGVYVQGIVSTAPTQTPTSNGQLTYYISVDGQATDQLQVYKGLGLNQATFTAQDDIQVGDEVTIYGNVKIYNSTKEFDTGNYLVAFNRPVVATPSITVNIPNPADVNADGGDNEFEVTYTNLAADPQLAVVFCDANGDAVADGTYNWITATYNATSGKIDGHIDVNTGDARTAYFKVSGKDANDNTVYSELITINQSAYNPSINIKTEGAIEFDATGGSKTLGVDYESLGSNPTFELQFFEYDGTTETQCGWITYSFASNDNKVTITGLNNDEGAARTAYFKVYAEVNKTKVYSNLVTVNQAAPVVDYATLPFAFDGGRADIENTSGLTQEGLDSDYGSSPKLKFNGSDDAVILKINERPGTLTFDIKGNPSNNVWAGTFKVQTSEDGMTYTDFATYTDLTSTVQNESFDNLDENVRYIKWIYTEKSSGNVALGNITVAQYVAPVLTPSITITPATINAKANDNGGELTVSYENLAATPNLQIVFCDANGDAVANGTYDWINAEFNTDGNIVGTLQPNTGDARTAYLVVTGVDADNNVVKSNLVTINQAAPAAPSIVFNPESIDFDAKSGGKTIGGDYFQLKDFDSTPGLEILYYESDGDTEKQGGYDWLTADFNSNNQIVFTWGTNTGAARSAYLKIHAVNTTVYSNLFTINQAAAADPNTIIFDFTTNDWGLPLTSENVSERREFKKDGYTIALTAGGNNKYGFNTDGYLLLGKNGATLEFPIFDFLVDKITIEGNTGASTSVKQAIYMKTYSEGLKQASSTTTGATGTNEYNISWGCQAAGEELLLQVTSAHNTQITRILIHKKETVDVTIGSTGYATLYYGDKNFSYGRKGGVSAYAVNLTNGALKMEAISNQAVIPAGTAMVLEGNPGTHVFEVEDAAFSSIAAEAEVNFTGCDNLLRGYDEPALTTGPDAGDYLFYLLGVDNGKVGFYWGKPKGAAFTSGAHKAYLAVPTEQASGLRGFSFDGSVVGINTIGVDMPEGNAYDLQGRRVQQLQKNGLYIVDGKKLLAK
ncbi:MAG: BACON domain-containing carbohydrate-binding protein [Alloprevotella sp.]|nr:BACON domain-containing carbohydrate-binding protein [Alloprevotella sp.]